ncbi:MAG: HEAT repeat domain-containing protein [Pirellulaceae bacterium]|jgi:hypothetical protein|nr:HEAT repeat domain-containing protein [Pirellulaceae bacterium]MDP7019019.1 HEAT repeat domain-containing protein [Pirellulaceae bacterium]
MPNAELQRIVDQLPDPDNRQMLTTNIDKERMEKTAAALAGGGKAYVLGLIEMLGEPGTVEDSKPHLALHLVTNRPLVAKNERQRKEFCEAIASQVSNDMLSNYNRAYLCQELQWAGRDEACPALGAALLNEDLTDAAATALAAIGGERAASQLRAAAGEAQGKCRANIMDALAALDDPNSTETLRQGLEDKDREVRIAAAIGLANVGAVDAANTLLATADAAKGWERTQLTKSCLVLAENLAAAGKKQEARRIYESLKKSRSENSEAHVEHAVELGLAATA